MRTTSLAAAVAIAASLALVPASVGPAGAASAGPGPSAAGETCDGKAATIVVPPTTTYPVPWVTGTPGDDVIVGTDSSDRIDGAGGNDTICGLDDNDQILGGPGDDRLFGGLDDYSPDDDLWGDVIQPGPGDDHIDLGSDLGPDDITFVDSVYADKVSYADAPGPVRVDLTTLTATGHGNDTLAATPAEDFTGIIGSPHADVLLGGPAHDQIHGGGGDDTITGGPGKDDLDGDRVTGLDHSGKAEAGDGDDVVSGGPDDDVLSSGAGTDVLRGEDGDDLLSGQDRADGGALIGGPGEDHLLPVPDARALGGAGDDSLYVVLPRSTRAQLLRTLSGGAGRDRLTFQYYGNRRPGFDVVVDVPRRAMRVHGRRYARLTSTEEFYFDGNKAPGSVTFRGGPASEVFRVRWAMGFRLRAFGGGGRDVLVGGERADLLDGGPGRDRLNGRTGRDRCVNGEQVRQCEVRR